MTTYRSTTILTLTILLTACAAGREEIKREPPPVQRAPARESTQKVRYTDEGVGFPILPFMLSTKTGIAPPDLRIVPEEAGFWLAGNGDELRWTVERRDGNLVAFHEGESLIRFATFHLNETRQGRAFELMDATLFGADGKPLIKVRLHQPLPDLTRLWSGRFETGFSLESNVKAASFDGEVDAEKDTHGTIVRFYRDNMLAGRTPLFSVRMTTATDGSFLLGSP